MPGPTLIPRRPAPAEPYPTDFETLSAFHALTADPLQEIPGETWRDLDMDSVFNQLDHTRTPMGRQWLYARMRSYATRRELEEGEAGVAFLEEHPDLAERLAKALTPLARPETEGLGFFLHDPPPQVRHSRWILLASLLPVASVLLSWLWHPLLFAGIGGLLLNLGLHETLGRSVTLRLWGLRQLGAFLAVGEKLAEIPGPLTDSIRDRLPDTKPLRHRLAWFRVPRAGLNDMIQACFDWMNALFLVDLRCWTWLRPLLADRQETLRSLHAAVGRVDGILALHTARQQIPDLCRPQWTEGPLSFRRLVHPLLADPVANDLDLDRRSLLLTGSNMAGKTTFLRAVGVALILARTLNVCHAEEACLPWARLHASIRREDSLGNGRSTYLAEVESIKSFLVPRGGERRVFLLDEIFRGTNTLERLSGATAVLEHLASRGTVLVTTHDLELVELLEADFEIQHFCEAVSAQGELAFDYRLHPGPVRTRNALRLLEAKGYPPEILSRAWEIAEDLDHRTFGSSRQASW